MCSFEEAGVTSLFCTYTLLQQTYCNNINQGTKSKWDVLTVGFCLLIANGISLKEMPFRQREQ